jgi:NAD(P)H-flavin reductase
MLAKKTKCTVDEITWISPTTLRIRFHAHKRFSFVPGQFISLVIPSARRLTKPIKRLYSLASSPEEGKNNGTYELCVRYAKGGIGSEFLATSQVGDTIFIHAPYGDFQYRPPEPGRNVCLIGTGSGLAPLRSIITSSLFQDNRPEKTLCLLGVRNEKEKIYEKDFALAGVDTVYAVSQPSSEKFTGFKGRVTDFLKSPPPGWNWHSTDFYLCGNVEMVHEAERILRGAHGVPGSAISLEAFHVTSSRPKNVLPFPGTAQERETWRERLFLRAKTRSKI